MELKEERQKWKLEEEEEEEEEGGKWSKWVL